jgi:hypothetical protein
MDGILYYRLPLGNDEMGGGFIAVDLRTGEEIWYNEKMGYSGSGVGVPSFGYYMSVDSSNQHGVIPPGLLITSDFSQAFNPMTGQWMYNITGVPSGATIADPKGPILRYVFDSNTRTLAQWNSSRMWTWDFRFETPMYGVTLDGAQQSLYDWNITISGLGPGRWSIANLGIQALQNPAVALDDIMLLIQSETTGGLFGGYSNANITAVSLKPESRGAVLWTITDAPDLGVQRNMQTWDTDARIFVTSDREAISYNGYSLDDGSHVWGPEKIPTTDYEWFSTGAGGGGGAIPAYGKLYHAGWGGILCTWDIKTGDLLWTYGNGGPGNSTVDSQQPWGNRPIWISAIADGKIYLLSNEHSPNTPLYKNATLRCVDANDGTELWTLMGWGSGRFGPAQDVAIVADGYLAFANMYDMKVYTIGKGPSATTVESPKASIDLGKSLIISGTVIDISAGTKQDEQVARFPHGVPAVSDASMGEWMEYVYMQKPRPSNTVGVDVLLSIIDPNYNLHEITATSDSLGMYSVMWEPPVPGKYTVVATFEGTESYWPSQAETVFGVDDVSTPSTLIEPEEPTEPETPTEPEEPEEPTEPEQSVEAPLITTEVAIVAAVAIAAVIGVAAFWALRRRE